MPGPRYTSYPPALHFTDDFDPNLSIAELVQNTKPLSLYFHLPFCASSCWFCGCNKVITTDLNEADRYLDYLEKEMLLYSSYQHPGRTVTQLHLGGGTPNFFQPQSCNLNAIRWLCAEGVTSLNVDLI